METVIFLFYFDTKIITFFLTKIMVDIGVSRILSKNFHFEIKNPLKMAILVIET